MRLPPTILALALTCAPAHAEPFVLLIHEAPGQIALRDEKGPAGQAYWQAYADWGSEAQAAGILRGGAALAPVPVAVAGAGPAAGRLILGGFFQIDVAGAAEAEAWAAKLPAAMTGSVEVRAVVAAPDM